MRSFLWFTVCVALSITGMLLGCSNKHVYVVTAPAEDAGASEDSGPGAAPTADAGSSDSGVDIGDASADPCGIVPTDGVCLQPSQVGTCVVATGNGSRHIVIENCPAQDHCQLSSVGARCVPKPGFCDPGASQCLSATQGQICGDGGTWGAAYACPGCTPGAVGNLCTTRVPTTTYSGALDYEYRGPNAALTDWSGLAVAPAAGLFITSYSSDATLGLVPIATTVTAADGSFSIAVPSTPTASDLLIASTLETTANGGAGLAVVSPDIPAGAYDVNVPMPTSGANAAIWGWTQKVATLGAPGTRVRIQESDGSGALRLYEDARFVYDAAAALYGVPGRRVVLWFHDGTSFSCGSCEADAPTTFDGVPFDSQVFISSVAADSAYWSSAVTRHELGHWLMGSFGVRSQEGGPHIEGCPTFPGQAWSEGWATGFSSLARGSPVYYDKQEGTFFWFDISQMAYGDGTPWHAPSAAGGLLQLMDEDAVSAMLWNIAVTPASANLATNAPLFDALKSPRMTGATFARGYTTHTWSGSCDRTNIVDTGAPAPMIADFLDALECTGTPSSRITPAVANYPYPSSSPLCQ